MVSLLLGLYGDPIATVDRVPRTASEIYRAWAEIPPDKSLSRRERKERRWLGRYLEQNSKLGVITRRVIVEEGRTVIAFWRGEGQ